MTTFSAVPLSADEKYLVNIAIGKGMFNNVVLDADGKPYTIVSPDVSAAVGSLPNDQVRAVIYQLQLDMVSELSKQIPLYTAQVQKQIDAKTALLAKVQNAQIIQAS